MRRGVLAVYLLSLMTLAGCLGPETASWGSDGIDVDFSYEDTTINTKLGGTSVDYEGIQPIGCEPGDSASLSKDLSYPISFTGYLGASNLYDSHDPVNGASGLDLAVTTSVAIKSVPFSDAEKIVDGEGPRIDLKDWHIPLDPQTRAGTVDLDEIDSETEDYWYILGLIPTTSNIQDGMRSLNEWHQPVIIEGYLISPYVINGKTNSLGYYKSGNSSYSHSVDSDCNLNVGMNHKQSLYVLVEKIILEDSVVTADGESKDEWKYGDVPFFGRAGFILFFLVVGIGGGFGLFILSQLFVIQGAKSTMKTLLGKEGIAKIKKVATDLRRSKATGMLSPKERQREIEKEEKQEMKANKSKPSSSKSKKDDSISGFDLDSVLSSGPSTGITSEFGDGKPSVVATAESIEMDRETEVKTYSEPEFENKEEYQPKWKPPAKDSFQNNRSNNVVSEAPRVEKREHFSSIPSESPASSSAPVKKKTVRKRKSAKPSKPEPKPEPEPEPERNSFGEEDDFSNFSM